MIATTMLFTKLEARLNVDKYIFENTVKNLSF